MKVRDPSDVTRDLVARTLTEADPAFGQANVMWLRDKPVRWLDDILHTAVRYRSFRGVLDTGEAAIADRRAVEVAAVVAARELSGPRPGPDVVPADAARGNPALEHALRSLDRIEESAVRGDTTTVPGTVGTRRAIALASMRSVLTWRSQTLRHAVRTALGVLITFLVAWATVGMHDPLVTSMSTASFAILQISWTQSLLKAKERLAGVAAGAALMAVALWTLPEQALLPLALLAALAGLWLIASNQVLSIGCFVVVSVGMNAVGRGLDPSRTLLEYILLLYGAVVIGLLLGFVVVPHLRPDRVDERVRRTERAAAEMLRCAAQQTGPNLEASNRRELMHALYRLRTAVENLRPPLDLRDELAGIPATECASLATRFETLAIIGALEADQGRLSPAELSAAAAALSQISESPQGDAAREQETDFVRLAQWVARCSTEFLAAYADPTQPPNPEDRAL